MPKDPSLNVTRIDDDRFAIILPLFTKSVRSIGVEKRIKVVIENYNINFTNINGHNLLASAMIANREEVVKILIPLATEEEIKDAQVQAKRNIDPIAEYVAYETIVHDIKQERKNTISEIVAKQNLEELEEFLKCFEGNINIHKENGFTILGYIVMAGWQEGFEVLQAKEGVDLSELHNGILLLAPEDFIKDAINAGLCTAADCMIKAASDPKYTQALGPIIATLEGGVNVRLTTKGTALHEATSANNPKAITALMKEHNADPEIKNDDGHTPIQEAVINNILEAFTSLYENGVNLEVTTEENKENLLHLANGAEITDAIMKLPQASRLMRAQDKQGNFPTHKAAFTKNAEVLQSIINGCPQDINIKQLLAKPGSKGKNVFELIHDEDDKIRDILTPYMPEDNFVFEEEQSTEAKEQEKLVTPLGSPVMSNIEYNNPLLTPINLSEESDEVSVCTPIVHSPDVDRSTTITDEEIQSSVKEREEDDELQSPSTEVMETTAIIEKVQTSVNEIGDYEEIIKSLIKAIEEDNEEQINVILEKNNKLDLLSEQINVDLPRNKGHSLVNVNINFLHLAALRNKAAAALALIENGIALDEQEEVTGYTAMHFAVKYARQSIISILPSSNFVLKSSSKYGEETPAELAAYEGNANIFDFIITLLEDISLQKNLQYKGSAIEYTHLLKAIKGQHAKIVKDILKKHPTFLHMCDKDTMLNPLMEVAKSGNTELLIDILNLHSQVITPILRNIDMYNQNILHYIAKYCGMEAASALKILAPGDFQKLITLKGGEKSTFLPIEVAINSVPSVPEFQKWHEILAYKETVKKGLFGSKIIRECVLGPSYEKLNADQFYLKYEKKHGDHPPESLSESLAADNTTTSLPQKEVKATGDSDHYDE